MKKLLYIIALLGIANSACNKVDFKDVQAAQKAQLVIDPENPPMDPVDPSPTPVIELPTATPTPTPTATPIPTVPPTPTPTATPTPTPPIQVIPDPVRTSGICVDGQDLLSCLKCEVPVVVQPTPALPSKAQKLSEIMTMSCPIDNGSHPEGYQAPSREEIFKRMEGCTADVYPETAMTSGQTNTVNRLLDPNDSSLRQTMFERFWYTPPHTDNFELYFGLSNAEAVGFLCWGGDVPRGPLQTSEYWQAQGSDRYWEWLFDPAAQARYQQAQVVRQQLQACYDQASNYQENPPPPPVPKVCDYKTFDGYYDVGGREEINSLLADGYKVGIEGNNSCQLLTADPGFVEYVGEVKIAGYRCQ